MPSIRRGQIARLAIRAIRAARRALLLALEVVLAAVILFEEWGWRPLSAVLASLARFRLVARLEAAVAALPPWPALGVFLVPSLLFLPLKLLALWLIAGGRLMLATALFVFAKLAGTALYARIFQLTQPSLMRLAWFAAAYTWFIGWKEAIIAHARQTATWQLAVATGDRARAAMRDVWRRLRPGIDALVRRVRAFFAR